MHCAAVIERFGMRAGIVNCTSIRSTSTPPASACWPVAVRRPRGAAGPGPVGRGEICELIRAEGVSILGFTPSYGSQLAQWLESQGRQLPVRMCITGGEALTGEHLQRIRQAFAPASFFNAYGPTETVVMPLACLAPERLEEGAASVPIGSVVGARVAYILDADLALVPQGRDRRTLRRRRPAWRAATMSVRRSAPSASCPIPSLPRAAACTAPATWCACATTARWNMSAASTTR